MALYNYNKGSGIITSDTSLLLTDTQTELKNALGEDLVFGQSTPEDALANAEVLARKSAVAMSVETANQINPNYSQNTWLDSIAALMDIDRVAGLATTYYFDLTGTPGTEIESTKQIKVGEHTLTLLNNVTIGPSNVVTGEFAVDTVGPITIDVVPATIVAPGVLGWETAINPQLIKEGNLQQSDVSFRSMRRQALANQGRSLPQAIYANVRLVEGVRSLSFRENVESTTQVIDGITMLGHSIYVCVDGGEDKEVALAVKTSKSDGASYNGSTSVALTDPYSGQSYIVKFDRPSTVQMAITVTIKSANSTATTENIKQAVIDYANGEIEGEDGFIVGASVSPFEIASAINKTFSYLNIKNCTAGPQGGAQAAVTYDIELNEKATIQVSDITVNYV